MVELEIRDRVAGVITETRERLSKEFGLADVIVRQVYAMLLTVEGAVRMRCEAEFVDVCVGFCKDKEIDPDE